MNGLHPPERELCRLYEQQVEKYESVLQISDRLVQAFAARQETGEPLERMALLLDEIACLGRRAEQPRQRWAALQRRPSGRLQTVLDRLEHLVRELIDRISSAEASARQIREGLLPELGREALGQQMRQAYAAAVRSDSA